MAALTPTAIITDGEEIGEFSGSPIKFNFTFVGSSDTFDAKFNVRAWACKPDTTDVQTVSYSTTTGIFSLASGGGAGKTITLYIWPAFK